VVPGAIRDYATQTPRVAALIVEVSDSTLFLDQTTKAELYAVAGVPEYWIVDLVNRQMIVHRDPLPLPDVLGTTVYRTVIRLSADDKVSPLAVPTASIRVGELLP
jgi:Uma2 family endonuclease